MWGIITHPDDKQSAAVLLLVQIMPEVDRDICIDFFRNRRSWQQLLTVFDR